MAKKNQPEPKTEPAAGGKVGVYVCHCGGNISDAVDVEKVCEQARQIPGVVVARENMFMCSDPGQEMIIEDLKSGLVDRVVVASCSPSLHETTFRNVMTRAGANPYVYEQANLREQVSWVHHGPEATAKASHLVAAAAAKAVVNGVEIFMPLAGVIDFTEEDRRLAREIEKIGKELAQAQRKLANEDFLAKAPEEVVNKEKERLQSWTEKLTKLKTHRDRIKELMG